MQVESDDGTLEVRSIDFEGLRISYDDRVITPRPWTRAQSSWASQRLPGLPPGPVLEVCCGAGHIGLAAVQHHPRHLVMVDADATAVGWALRNAQDAAMADRVEVRHGRLEDAVRPTERFPLVIADPPWVPTSSVDAFPDDPVLAIDGGDDGLLLVRACLELIGRCLLDDGLALLQVGPTQVAAVEALVSHEAGWSLRVDDHLVVADRGAVIALVRP